jgi:hypothetical protein
VDQPAGDALNTRWAHQNVLAFCLFLTGVMLVLPPPPLLAHRRFFPNFENVIGLLFFQLLQHVLQDLGFATDISHKGWDKNNYELEKYNYR